MANPLPPDFPRQLQSRSLLEKYLTPEVWKLLKDLQTSMGVNLLDCIRSGLAYRDSAIGVYAGDQESLDQFDLLFAPLIQDLQGRSCALESYDYDQEAKVQPMWNPDPRGMFIRSTRIRLARNLTGYRLMPTISRGELLEVQGLAVNAFSGLENDLAGSYSAMCAPGVGPVSNVIGKHSGFDGADRFQQAAGMCRDWPEGRGVYSNPAQSLQVWVNEEDHLRIISMQADSDIESVYARLLEACGVMEKVLHFQRSERYGYVASCPSNLGTGLRASFHIHLPLSGGSPAFKSLCSIHGIAVRSAAGEGGLQNGAMYDISNSRRLGLLPEQCIHALLTGVEKIIELEMQSQ